MKRFPLVQPATCFRQFSAGLRAILLLGPATLFLAACTGKTITQDRPIVVNTPVNQPCALPRPSEPTTLHQRYPDAQWAAMDVRQKAAAVGRWGIDQQIYGRNLAAATGACE